MENKTSYFVLFGALLVLVNGPPCFAAEDDHARYLTIPDMERACQCKVGKMVTRGESALLPGDVNFLDPEGKKLLSITFETADKFQFYKSGVPKNVAEEISAVDDEAFFGPVRSRGVPNVLTVRKANACIKMCAGITENRYENRLTREQLIAIGRVIVSRM